MGHQCWFWLGYLGLTVTSAWEDAPYPSQCHLHGLGVVRVQKILFMDSKCGSVSSREGGSSWLSIGKPVAHWLFHRVPSKGA